MNTPNGPDRDEYLFRLDFAIRKMHSQTWDDEDARTSSLFGLLTARALYTRPDEARNDQRAQLTEALAGPLVDEPGDELAQMTQQAGAFLAGPSKVRPDGWTQRDSVIRALAVLVKAELVRKRRGGDTYPAAAASGRALRALVQELGISAWSDVDQLTSILREAL